MSTPATPRPNPFVGPRAFVSGEKLYGRDREVRELFDLLLAERVVLLHSPSGAGKTSLIEAGLRPRLEKKFRILPVLRVGLAPAQPPSNVNRYLLSLLLSLEGKNTASLSNSSVEVAEKLSGVTLADYLDRYPKTADKLQKEILIFDQFEEILTLDPTDHEGREAFFAQVGAALSDRSRWALFAMREEYRAALEPYLGPLPTRLGTTFRLDLLSREAAILALQQPAADVGVEFTTEAASKLVVDLSRVSLQLPKGKVLDKPGQYVEPVQLQVVCLGLWDKWTQAYPSATTIEAEMVKEVGDVDSTLAEFYARQVKSVAGHTQTSERRIRDWFNDTLITKSGIRSQVLGDASDINGLPSDVLRLLDKAQLIHTEVRRNIPWYELAHDRLIKPVLHNNQLWYDQNLNLLQRQAKLWASQANPDSLLLSGESLQQQEAWAQTHLQELTEDEQQFLKKCCQEREYQAEQTLLAQRERERQEEQELQKRRAREQKLKLIRVFIVILFLGALVAIFLSNAARVKFAKMVEQQTAMVYELETKRKELEAQRQALDAISQTNALFLTRQGKGIEEVKESEAATKAMVEILKRTKPEERLATNVIYYHKPVDGQTISYAVRALKFTFKEEPSDDITFETSLMWFGKDVPLDHIKLLALTLVRSNIKLRFIRPYSQQKYEDQQNKYGAEALARLYKSISVGGGDEKDIRKIAYPGLITVEKIMAMTEENKGLMRN